MSKKLLLIKRYELSKDKQGKIIEQIKPIVPALLLSNFGKKIINKLMHQYNIVFQTDWLLIILLFWLE